MLLLSGRDAAPFSLDAISRGGVKTEVDAAEVPEVDRDGHHRFDHSYAAN
jgi:hypothetical protein